MLFLESPQRIRMKEGLRKFPEKKGPLPEKYLMTQTTYKRLIQEVSKREASLTETLRASGEASRDGDQWHDEQVRNLVDEELGKRRRLSEVKLILSQAEIITAPSQTERVELGHRVRVRFLNLPEESGEAHITLLGEQDVNFPHASFNQQKEVVISYKSPLGRAILGAAKSQVVDYSVETRPFQVKIIKIGISPLVVES